MNVLVRQIKLALCLGALFAMFSGTTVFGAERPNIVFIVADDLGWGHVGWQNSKVQTPHLDRLADGGVKLNHHYVAPVCSPTRVALMTGRYWSRFGVLGALPSEPTALARAMPSGTATIASALRASGYRTALVGKWHLGAQPAAGPEAFGFDYFYGIRVGGCTPLTHKWLGTGPSVLWDGNEIIDPSGHITDLFGEAATDWIARDSDDPFFLFLSFTAPHVPLQESERWMSLYEESAPDKSHQLYWAAISHLDEAVARVMAEIDRLGEKDNTLVVFLGDNGSPGQRNLMQVRVDHDAYLDVTLPGTNLPFRGKKGDVYDGGIRTPTFATWPAVLKPGVCNVPLHVTDWMPTLCALVGHQPVKELKWDGYNILPQLQAPEEPTPDRTLYTRRSSSSFALRHGEWKLVATGGQARAELYNIVEDCGETTELAAAHPEFVQRLENLQNEAATNDNDCVASHQPRTQLDPQAIAARIKQIDAERPDKARLAAYLNCGDQHTSATPGKVQIRRLQGRPFYYTHARDQVPPTQVSIDFDEAEILYEIAGLDSKARYVVGFTWWDQSPNGRSQTVVVRSTDEASSQQLCESVRLPNWPKDQCLPEDDVHQHRLDTAVHADGRALLSVRKSSGVNVVLCEMWVWELATN